MPAVARRSLSGTGVGVKRAIPGVRPERCVRLPRLAPPGSRRRCNKAPPSQLQCARQVVLCAGPEAVTRELASRTPPAVNRRTSRVAARQGGIKNDPVRQAAARTAGDTATDRGVHDLLGNRRVRIVDLALDDRAAQAAQGEGDRDGLSIAGLGDHAPPIDRAGGQGTPAIASLDDRAAAGHGDHAVDRGARLTVGVVER